MHLTKELQRLLLTAVHQLDKSNAPATIRNSVTIKIARISARSTEYASAETAIAIQDLQAMIAQSLAQSILTMELA